MITLKELARRCTVSIATVSNILNGKSNVGEETKKRVLEVIKETGYKPNIMARGLRANKTKTIGLIVEDLTAFSSPWIVEGVMSYLEEKGYGTVLENLRMYTKHIDTWENQNSFSKIVNSAIVQMISIKVDGVEKTFITNQYKDLGQIADFYYTPGEARFTSDNALNTGQVILIEYISIIQGRQIVIDQNEIAKVSNLTDRNGTISRYEKRNDATTSNELQNIGKSYIQYKGVPEIILNIEATTNIWNVGERVSFENAPIEELETE